MIRIGRIAFILTISMIALVTGTYYTQVPVIRILHHAIVSGLGVAGMLWLWRGGGLPRHPLTLPILLALAVWLVSAALAIDPRVSLENAWFPVGMALIALTLIGMMQRGKSALVVETTFLLTILITIFALVHLGSWYLGWGITPDTQIGWVQAVAVAPLPLEVPMIYMPLGVSTWLAAFCAPMVVLTFAYGRAARRPVRIVFYILAGLLLIALLATGSRGGLIALAVAAVAFIGLTMLRRDTTAATPRRTIALLVVGIALLAIAGVLLISRNVDRLIGDAQRVSLWRGAVSVFATDPLTGVGVGMFGAAYRDVREPSGWHDNRLGTAHNAYLNSLAETGILGALVMILCGMAIGWAMWRRSQDAMGDTARQRWHGTTAALIGFAAQSMFDTFVSAALMLFTVLLIALVTAERRGSLLDEKRSGWRRGAALALAIGMVGYGAAMIVSDSLYLDFRESGDMQAVEAVAARDPQLILYRLQIADMKGRAGDPDADRYYADALSLAPDWDIGWINRAALAEARGEYAAALTYLDRARQIDRFNGATAHWGRIAEAHRVGNRVDEWVIDDAQIIAAYILWFDGSVLPLSPFWAETPLRQLARDTLINEWVAEQPDLAYRVLRETAPDQLPSLVGVVRGRARTGAGGAADAWVIGEAALTAGDATGAMAAFSEAVRLNSSSGDYVVSRVRARIALDPDDPLIQADLHLAALLTTRFESVNAVRAEIVDDPTLRQTLLVNAVPPQIIDQNFEGISYGGRVVGFTPFETMRKPGIGVTALAPWFTLEAEFLAAGDAQRASVVRGWIEMRLG
jgi:O-antigen ligase/tetratricopeptide (TPR) repeat protein